VEGNFPAPSYPILPQTPEGARYRSLAIRTSARRKDGAYLSIWTATFSWPIIPPTQRKRNQQKLVENALADFAQLKDAQLCTSMWAVTEMLNILVLQKNLHRGDYRGEERINTSKRATDEHR
jgi:hypothetical protein